MDIFRVIQTLRHVLEEAEARYRSIGQIGLDAGTLDAVIVLSHGRFEPANALTHEDVKEAERSEECRQRVESGARFVNAIAMLRPHVRTQRVAPSLVLCGAAQQMPAMREWALAFGIHEDVIVELAGTAFPVTNTRTQFLDINAIVKNLGWRHVIVVSSDYHLRCPYYGARWLDPEVRQAVSYAYLPMLCEATNVVGKPGGDLLSLFVGDLERIIRYSESGDLPDPLET